MLAKLAVTHGGLKLEYAPSVTETIAFAIQLTPALILLTARADWLNPPWAHPLALVMIATLPAVEEVWLNTINSHFQLALAAAIVLNTQPGKIVYGKVRTTRKFSSFGMGGGSFTLSEV